MLAAGAPVGHPLTAVVFVSGPQGLLRTGITPIAEKFSGYFQARKRGTKVWSIRRAAS